MNKGQTSTASGNTGAKARKNARRRARKNAAVGGALSVSTDGRPVLPPGFTWTSVLFTPGDITVAVGATDVASYLSVERQLSVPGLALNPDTELLWLRLVGMSDFSAAADFRFKFAWSPKAKGSAPGFADFNGPGVELLESSQGVSRAAIDIPLTGQTVSSLANSRLWTWIKSRTAGLAEGSTLISIQGAVAHKAIPNSRVAPF